MQLQGEMLSETPAIQTQVCGHKISRSQNFVCSKMTVGYYTQKPHKEAPYFQLDDKVR